MWWRRSLGLAAVLSWLALASPAGAAIAHVQSTLAEAAPSAASIAVAYGANNAAGNLLIALVTWGTSSTTVTVTDSQSQTWVQIDALWDATLTAGLATFYSKNSGAGANTVTASFAANQQFRSLIILEYSGADTTAPLDVHNIRVATSGIGTDNAASTAATPTVDGTLILGGIENIAASTIAPGTGFTERQDGTGNGIEAEDLVQPTAASIAATWTIGNSLRYLAAMAAFKPAAGAAAAPQRSLLGVGQ